MEQEKNNIGVLLTIIILLILFGCCLFTLNKLGYLSFNKQEDKCVGSASKSEETTNTVDNSSTSTTIDLSKLESFKNTNGSYGNYESFTSKNWDESLSYSISLSLDGKVKILDNKKSSDYHTFEVNDVIDIINFHEDPTGLGYCYMLTKNNEVYYYDISKAANNNYDAVKVDEATDVIKLMEIHYCPWENSGCAWTLIGLKKDGSYVSLGTGSV